MLFWDLLIRGNKMLWVKVPPEEAIETKITDVKENIIWVNLPRKEGQILVLEQNQRVEIGFSLPDGYYSAETVVAEIGKEHGKVYGLLIPEKFERKQRRTFVRSRSSGTVKFTATSPTIKVTSELYNFSASGLRVYVTSELEEALEQKKTFYAKFEIHSKVFSLPVKLVWLKYIDNILNAGFQFADIKIKDEENLMALALKYSRKQ